VPIHLHGDEATVRLGKAHNGVALGESDDDSERAVDELGIQVANEHDLRSDLGARDDHWSVAAMLVGATWGWRTFRVTDAGATVSSNLRLCCSCERRQSGCASVALASAQQASL
jgi:hypothetical protein